MNYSKIGTIEGILLICIGLLNHAILYLPQAFFNVSGTGSILNVIYICIVVFIFICIYMKWYKNFHGQDIIDISKYVGGNVLKVLTGILFIGFYLVMTSIMIRSFAENFHVAYFSHIDFKVILLMFFIILFFAHKFGKKGIIRCNTIITVLMLVSLFVLFISIIPKVEIPKMFPILGNGASSILIQGLGNLYAFSGICLLFFIAPMLKDPKSLNKVAIISFCIMSVVLISVIFILLLGFSFLLHVEELSPIYLLVKSIEFGEFFQNPESLFVLVWILSIISFASVFSMVIIIITQKLLHFSDYSGLSALENSLNRYLENILYEYLYKTSMEFNSDISGFGRAVMPQFLTSNAWTNYNWNENYKNSFFKVNVSTSIDSSNLILKT